jgi:hypothetical protein
MGLAARRLAEAHPLERNFSQIFDVYREVEPACRTIRGNFSRAARQPKLARRAA